MPADPAAWSLKALDDLDPAELADAVALLATFEGAGDRVWTPAHFEWKLGPGNPAGRGFLSVGVADGRVIGVTSVTPKRVWWGGRVVAGAEIGDTFTDGRFVRSLLKNARRAGKSLPGDERHPSADYRTRSVFGRLVDATRTRAMASGIRVVFGTPNKQSFPGYVKYLGFREHPTHKILSFVRPTAKAVLNRLPPALRSRWFDSGARGAFALFGASGRLALSSAGFSVAPVHEPGPELDALWERCRTGKKFSLVKDAAYFRHRFLANPEARYSLLGARDQAGTLVGVMVCRELTTAWGKRHCVIADWLLEDSDLRGWRTLLSAVVSRTDASELDGFSLWVPPSPAHIAALRLLGFLQVGEAPLIVYDEEEGRAILDHPAPLDFTMACSDNI